jgi:hypothetical protein
LSNLNYANKVNHKHFMFKDTLDNKGIEIVGSICLANYGMRVNVNTREQKQKQKIYIIIPHKKLIK